MQHLRSKSEIADLGSITISLFITEDIRTRGQGLESRFVLECTLETVGGVNGIPRNDDAYLSTCVPC